MRNTINKHLGFTDADRLHQAQTMHYISNIVEASNSVAIADFICPFKKTRMIFQPDVVVYIHRDASTKYEDTAKIFEPPTQEEADELGYILIDVTEETWFAGLKKVSSLIQ